ncbi:hypothetical protein IQ235_12555 [Oscillatoriales cyanobacterium LEGE 11467]|uniref:Uncharacterized protein n=1 Tax=Zarconia navalis LEGE 11467 TaxID=1828826 RepID=A0A928W0B9_9CYAN|nr:hypothetical protein [Zarconia navalis]MBE9041611.1 hypothetical protein [Zarconia navalis LEGE 11467]
MESIDDLLAQVKAEYGDRAEERDRTVKQQQRQQSPPSTPAPPSPHPSAANVDRSIAELRGEYQQRDRLEAQKQQEREAQVRRQQEQQRQQQRQALRQVAQTWLKNLDRYSGEGLWFTEFAQGYPSQLEAAIDYLEALK